MMKVLFTTNIPSPYRVAFFNELGKYCDLTVTFENAYAQDRDDEWKKYSFKNFKGVFLKGLKYGQAEAFCPEINSIIKKGSFDIIVVGFYASLTGMESIVYMNIKRIPYILNTDGGFVKETSKLKYKMKRYFIGSATAWLSTGEMASDYLMAYGARKNDIWTYPFASLCRESILDIPLSIEEKKIIRKKLNIEGHKVILSVGQFIPRKGYDILLQAVPLLKDNYEVYIIGGTPTEEYLDICEKYELKNVHFFDFMPKERIYDYYKAADVFVLPTREDVWGLVINEAMAFGLPVVTTDKCVAGIEMVTQGENGYIVPIESSTAIADAINNIDRLDARASLSIAEKYSIEEMAKSHVNFFNSFLKGKK